MSLAPTTDTAESAPARHVMHHLLIIVGVTLAALLPFLGKPLHIDDPMYVWTARHIAAHPLDFYGFDVNWTGTSEPLPNVMQNPPGVSYYLAGAAQLIGWSEAALHLALLVPAVATVLGVYVLSSWWCARPLTATLAFALTPAFLVCASTIMCDVMMLCLWIWAIVLWEMGLSRRSHTLLFAASLLISAGMFTKYFGVALIPLLLAYSLVRTRRLGWWVVWFAVPLLALAVFESWTARLYGRGLFFDAMVFASNYQLAAGRDWDDLLVVGLAFLGGGAIMALFFAPRLWPGWVFLAAGIVGALFIVVLILKRIWHVTPVIDNAGPRWSLLVQAAVLMLTGLGVLALAVMDVWRHRTPESIMLALWVLGTFTFSAILNWSVTVRTILPAVPAIAILVMRRLDDRAGSPRRPVEWSALVALALTGVVGLSVLWGDFRLAESGRQAARRIMAQSHAPLTTIWFSGHWGFQYYMEQLGAKPIDLHQSQIEVADTIVVPMNNASEYLIRLPPYPVEPLLIPMHSWAVTISGPAGAGFYSSARGALPFVFALAPPEEYRIFVVTFARSH